MPICVCAYIYKLLKKVWNITFALNFVHIPSSYS